ncbi:MAG: LPD38 domain-containing protein [Methanolobus sp.]|nr:LPD38 domain-containing protein [Methanolobus sp.]
MPEDRISQIRERYRESQKAGTPDIKTPDIKTPDIKTPVTQDTNRISLIRERYQQMGMDSRPDNDQGSRTDNDQSWITNLSTGVEAGYDQMRGGLKYLGGEVVDWFDGEQPGTGDRWKREAASILENAPQGDGFWYDFGSFLPQTVGSLAAVLATPFTGGTSLAAIPAIIGTANIATIAGMSVGSSLHEYDQYTEEMGLETSEMVRLGTGLLNGAIEYAAEKIRLGRFLPKGGLVKKMTAKMVAKNPSLSKNILHKFAQQSPTGYRKYIKAGAYMLNQGKEEGLEELFTETAQSFVNMAYKGEDAWDDFGERAWKSFRGGAMMGIGIGTAGVWATNKTNTTRRKKHGVTLAEYVREKESMMDFVKAPDGSRPLESGVVEIAGTTKNGNYIGITPKGKQIELLPDQISKSITMSNDDFEAYNNALGENHAKAKEILDDVYVKDMTARIDGTVDEMEYFGGQDNAGNGKYFAASDEKGQAIGFVISGSLDTQTDGLSYLIVSDGQGGVKKDQIKSSKIHTIEEISRESIVNYLMTNAGIEKQNMDAQQKAQEAVEDEEVLTNDRVKTKHGNGVVTKMSEVGAVVQLDNGEEKIIPVEELEILRDGIDAEEETVIMKQGRPTDKGVEATSDRKINNEPSHTVQISAKKSVNIYPNEDGTQTIGEGYKDIDEAKAVVNALKKARPNLDKNGFEIINLNQGGDEWAAPEYVIRYSPKTLKDVQVKPTSELEDNKKTGSKESAIGDTRADDGKAGGEDVKTGELKTEVTPGDGVSAIQTGSENPATGGESNRAGEEIKSNSREQFKGKVEKPLAETSEVTEPTPIKEVTPTEDKKGGQPKESDQLPEAGKKVKQPWEMTNKEFTKFYNEYGFENGVSKYKKEQRDIIVKNHKAGYFQEIPSYELTQKEYILAHRTGWTSRLGKIGEVTIENAKLSHKIAVEEAVENNIIVPAEVLKDYPELFEGKIDFMEMDDDTLTEYIKSKENEYGGKNKWLISDEYKGIYPALKKRYDSKTEELQKLAAKKLDESGLKIGDNVQYAVTSGLGLGQVITGTLVNRKGFPYVKTEVPVNGGKKSVMWNKGWVKTTVKESLPVETPVREDKKVVAPIKPQGVKDTPKPQEKQRPAGEVLLELTDKKTPKVSGKDNKISTESAAKVDTPELSKKAQKMLNELQQGKPFNEVSEENELTEKEQIQLAKLFAESDKFPSKQYANKDKIDIGFESQSNHDVKPIEKKITPIKDNSTASKISSLKSIVAGDDKFPILTGVFKDAENDKLVATDAYVMIVIEDKTIKKSEVINPKTGEFIADGADYPNYDAEIPRDNPLKRTVNVNEWLAQLNGLVNTKRFFSNPLGVRIIIGDNTYHFKSEKMQSVFQVFAEHGVENVELQFSDPTRALVVESNKGIMGLVMPIVENAKSLSSGLFGYKTMAEWEYMSKTTKGVEVPTEKKVGEKAVKQYSELTETERELIDVSNKRSGGKLDIDNVILIAEKIAKSENKEIDVQHVSEALHYEMSKNDPTYGRLTTDYVNGNIVDGNIRVAMLERMEEVGVLPKDGVAEIKKAKELADRIKKMNLSPDVKSLLKRTIDTFYVSDANQNNNSLGIGVVDNINDLLDRIDKNKDNSYFTDKKGKKTKLTFDQVVSKEIYNKIKEGETTEGGVSTLEEKKIEDFGEKIEGARKDQIKKYFDKINLNGKILSTIFPKPDIKGLLESGLSVKDVAAIKVAHEFATSDKKKGEKVIKFYAAYAKNILAESINLEFKNNDYVFSEYGKSQIELRTKAYQDVHDKLGADYLALDLTKVKIQELDKSGRTTYFSGGEKVEDVNYIVKYYVSTSKYFKGLPEAITYFTEQVKANTKVDEVIYKRKLNIYYDKRVKGEFYIGYKSKGDVIKLKDGFKTSREARDTLKNPEMLADIQTMLERILAENRQKSKPSVRLKYTNETARERVGKDWRGGKDIGSEELATTFGFRAIEFGNWVNQKERQVFINNTYDSLMDLAQLLGISPKSISLAGNLGLTFGSRGSGKAAAHYEPGRRIINLTKTQGLGSLAHEWWHGIDNYFAGFETTLTNMKSASASEYTPEAREEIKKAFDNLAKAVNNYTFKQRSKNLDGSKNAEYYALPHEMSARAFENFTLNRLAQSGQVNDFIVNYVSSEDWKGEANKYPYPVAEETEKITEAFSELFETIQEKTDEEGNSVLFAKAYNEAERVPPKVIDRIFEGEQVSRKPKETTFEYAKRLFRQAKKNAPNAPDVVVVKKIEDLKGVLSDKALTTVKNFDTAHGTPAFYVNGKMYVIAENIKGFNSNFAAKLWLHEVGVHHGLNILFNETQKQETLQKIADFAGRDNMLAFIKKETNNKGLTGYENLGDTELAEEYLAYLSKKMDDPSKVTAKERSVWAKIVEWIRSKVKNFLGHNISNKDVMDIVKSAVQANYTDSSITGITSDGVRFQIAGESGAANLDKAEAATTRLDNLGVAKKMESKFLVEQEKRETDAGLKHTWEISNEDALKIRMATGWEKGSDGEWRYEIPDYIRSVSDVFALENKSKGTVIHAASVFASKEVNIAYPQLNDITVRIDISDKENNTGSFSHVTINSKNASSEITVKATDVAKAQSILLHEIQHAIQEIEGFARGGNVNDMALRDKLRSAGVESKEQLQEKIKQLKKEYQRIYNEWESKAFGKRYKGQTAETHKLLREWRDIEDEIKELESNKYDYDKAFSLYKKLAGEVEARNVQNRINMSEEDRRRTPLKKTEDTPRKDQIIYEGDDVKFMANQTGDPNFDSRHEPIIKGAYENSLEIFHDNMRSVKTLQELITKRGGVMGEDLDTYLFENLTSSISKAEIENFENSIQRRFLGAVKHIAGRYGIDADGIGMYLMAKHASERNKVMQMQGFKLEEGSGMSDVEAEAYIREFEGKVDQADIKELLDSRSEVTGFTLRTLNEKGLITNDQYRKYKNQYTDYVPLRGWAGETASDIYKYIEDDINRDAPPMKHAKGRTSLADNPLPYMLSMAHAAIIMGNKNVMKTKALNMVRANSQMQDLFSENPVYEVKQDDGTTITTVNRPDQELFDQKKVTVIKDTRNLYKNTIHNASQHDVIVYDNGEKKVISFTDPVVARSINGENIMAKDFVRKVLSPTVGRVQRFISANFTSKNPAFVPVNWTRDFGYAYFSHFVKGDKGDAEYFRKSMMNSFKAVSRHLKHNLGTTFSEQAINDAQIKISNGESLTNADYDALYYSFKMNGGETGYVHLKNINNFKNDIEKELRLAVGNPTRWEAANNYAPIKKAGEWMEYMAQMSENQARFSTYLVSMSKGKSHAQSASDAKNITVNFNRRGKVSGLMGNLYVFFNANVQGVANIGKLAKDHPKAFAKLGAGFMTMGFLSALLTRMWADDDDDENAFDKIPTYIKYNFWVLPNPAYYLGYGEKKEKFLTIPLPHGFRAVYALGVMAYEAATGTKGAGDVAIDLVTNTADSFSPISSLNPDEMLKGDITLRPIVPSWMMPFYDINVNRDFAGRMVYKEPFTKALEKKIPGSEQSLPNVNPLLKNAARGLNRLGGGDLNRTAAIGFNPKTTKVDAERNEWKWLIYDWNPSKAEHLLEYYLGGKGKFFNNIYKTTRDATLSVINKENQMNEYTTPILRRFIYTPYTKDTPDKYWELKNEISTWKGLYNDAKSNKDIEMMGRFQKNRRMMELINEFDRSEKRIKDMNERIDRSINPEMKKKLIKDRRMIIKDFLNKSKEIDKRHENSNR